MLGAVLSEQGGDSGGVGGSGLSLQSLAALGWLLTAPVLRPQMRTGWERKAQDPASLGGGTASPNEAPWGHLQRAAATGPSSGPAPP